MPKDLFSQVFLHQKVGLRIVTELEGMAANNAEAVLFIKPLRARVEFPNTEPHRVSAVLFSPFKARIHQRLADAFAKVFLLRV